MDPWNPTPTDIRTWAYEEGASEPCQDWMLALSWRGHERAYFEIVADEDCPNRLYFLDLHYFMIGNAVRNSFRNTAKPIVEGFIRHGDQYPHPDIREWQREAEALLREPELFDYNLWCGGELVKKKCRK